MFWVAPLAGFEVITDGRFSGDHRGLYSIVPLSDGIGKRAYELLKSYAKSHGLHVFDSLIAATAIENGFTLLTLNRKHYQMIDGLMIQVPDY